MYNFECNSIPEIYPDILRTVVERGRRVKPRGSPCFEISPLCISADSPRKRMFGTPGRNENPIFPYIEGLSLLSGENSPAMLSHYVKKVLCYANPQTRRFDGAYGPRVRRPGGLDQLEAVYTRLLKDKDSRRAVVTIFDPALDNNEDSLDVPCTISWQFMIRDEKLEMIVYMRSNDLFRGFVYDTVEFQWFQEIIAGWLGVEVGSYVHLVGSAHVYFSDMLRVRRILDYWQQDHIRSSIYDSCSPEDARLPLEAFKTELEALRIVEQESREGLILSEADTNRPLAAFQSPFYKNLALAIMGFNAKKHGRTEMSSKMFKLINNELGPLMSQVAQSNGQFFDLGSNLEVLHGTKPTPAIMEN